MLFKRRYHYSQIKSILESLKQCSRTKNLERGQNIHQHAATVGNDTNMFVATALITMYSKCGCMTSAQETFDKMPQKDIATWNSLILGYADNGESLKALEYFAKIDCKRSSVTYLAALKACSGSRNDTEKHLLLQKGMHIHEQLRKGGFQSNILVLSTVVDMYSKCGDMRSAQSVFNGMAVKNVVTWNCLIRGYVENRKHAKALDLLESMDCDPDFVTSLAAVKACAGLASEKESEKTFCLERGAAVHEQLKKLRLDSEIMMARNLVDMYGKCGSMQHAYRAFECLQRKDTLTWNALLFGYVENGEAVVAFERFKRMDCRPDSVTFVAMLKACLALAEVDRPSGLEKGRELHKHIRELGLESNVVVSSSLLDLYFKCDCVLDALEVFAGMQHRDVVTWNSLVARYAENGSMQNAREAFDKMPCQNAVTWNSLLLGYVESDDSLLALQMFESMECEPACITFVAVLKACANLGALPLGQNINARLCKLGLERDRVVANSLMDFYGKCGKTTAAEVLFDGVESPDIVSWNALMAGYSMVGNTSQVFSLASQVIEAGLRMTPITFVCVLTACSHAGMVERGKKYYQFMTKEYDISPGLEHYNCMVDMLGRANRFQEALEFLKDMSVEANNVTWKTLLGACRKWNNVDVGKFAFDSFVVGKFTDAAPYVLMGNIYDWKEE